MKNPQRGFTLIEAISALAIGALLMVGLSALIDTSLEDTRAQQAANYQAEVTTAASKYITDNYLALVAASSGGTQKVTLAQLSAGNYLPAGFQNANAWGQVPCVLVTPRPVVNPDGTTSNHLDALVVTEGGTPIPQRIAAYVAANAGQGGGHLVAEGGALVARGAFGSTALTGAALANFLSANCSGTAAGDGHLANGLFYDGPGRLTTDFLYRDAVPNRPELNRMTTPLQILLAVDAVENGTDTLCAAGDPNGQGRFVVNRNGVILTCQAGKWKRPPTLHWREPVSTFAALPTTDNQSGDVRMVQNLGRAFTWKVPGPSVASGEWVALAVDQNGNMTVENTLTAKTVSTESVYLTKTVVKNTACSPDGSLARDADGQVLSCKSGAWRSSQDFRIISTSDRVLSYSGGDPIHADLFPIVHPASGSLYISGYTYCNNSGGPTRVLIAIEIFDSSNTMLSHNGGCGSKGDGGHQTLVKTFMGLQKVPSNAAYIRVYVEPGTWAEDYIQGVISTHLAE